tara:strand:+ start:154 stop:801 length:648 start_codon:yes stop_codon:yes gene_type:complete
MKQDIRIPTNVGEMTLKQHQEMVSKEGNLTDEQLVSIYCNKTLDDVLQMPSSVYNKAVDILARSVGTIEKEQPLKMRFKLNGTEYGMIPNLDEITYGENKDLMQYIGDWKTMHLAMSVLYRPITQTLGSTYSIEKYNGTKEHRDVMQHMPLDIVLGSQVFFSRLTEELLRAIPNYLERVVHNSKGQMQDQSIKQTGEAMMKYSALLKETLEGLRR